MERPRLQRTYMGLRRRAGRGLARRAGLEWLPPAAIGGDTGEDRKRLFNSSASSGGVSFEDPDFLPPGKERKKRGKPQRKEKERKKGGRSRRKEKEKAPKENQVPPTPLRRNITLRRGARKGRPPSPLPALGEAPLLCSTPHATARPCPEEGPVRWDAIYGFRAETLREGGPHDRDNDVLPGLSFCAMSPEEDEEEKGLCAEAPFYGEHYPSAVLQREASPTWQEDRNDSAVQPQSSRHHWDRSPPSQSHSAERPNNTWSKPEKSLGAEEAFYAEAQGEHHPSALPRKGEASLRQWEGQSDSAVEPQSPRHHWDHSPPSQSHSAERPNDTWSKPEKGLGAQEAFYAEAQGEHHPSALPRKGETSLRQREGRSDSAAQPQHIGRQSKASLRQREDQNDSALQPQSSRHHWDHSPPFQSHSAERPNDTWSKPEKGLGAEEAFYAEAQGEHHPSALPRKGEASLRQSDSAAQPQHIGRESKASLRQWEGQSDSAAQPQHIGRQSKASLRQREDQNDSAAKPQDIWREGKAPLRHWEGSAANPPSQHCSTKPLNDIWSEEKASSTSWEDRSDSASLFQDIQSQEEVSSRCQEDFVACPIQDQTMAVPLKTEEATSKGAFQMQARFCGGKLALSLVRDHTPLSQKRQRVKEMPTVLDGASSEELNEGRINGNSPLLQPIVVLDNQAVPNWLASQSSQEQVADCCSQKTEDSFRPRSPCNLSSRSSHQQPPVCNTGITGRKACISGFSSKRWGQQKKPKQRHGKKNRVETTLLQQSLKNQVDDDYNDNNLALSFLSPESSFQNSALWRRIRASFSFHKKKKILSESESFSGSSIGAGSSFRLHGNETPQSPFTQRLGYSICPSSSMVLLSPFSMSQVMPTDAEKVYGECQQKGPVSFEECIPLRRMRKCQKIGEGVFGEVFRAEGKQGAVALKIIPIEGSERVNGEPQKTFGEILPEIIISKELSLLAEDSEEANQASGFIRLHSVHCVQGTYPKPLLAAWDEFHRLRTSENDRPDFFGAQQLFMVLEFEDGGTDLENMCQRKLGSVTAAKSILQQVAASLAVAEEALRFEHRDLHWGNVLIKSTDLKEVSVRLKGETLVFPTHGILVSIIDYTFSRLERDGLTVYCDLSTDEEVFQGRGDYQFDIYRQMREENANDWADYFPHSNILWLHYLVEKLLTEVTYKRKPTTSALKQLQKELKLFSRDLLGFQSAGDLLNGSPFFQ